MNVYFVNQSNKLPAHLERLKHVPVMQYNSTELAEKETRIPLNIQHSLDEIDLDFLFAYKIFPENILSPFTQWNYENRKMQSGDTIVQQIFIPPVKSISQKIICGVRVKDVIDEEQRKGFSYETLEGHVEKGISIFTVEESRHGIFFVIKTFSEPAHFLAKLVAPVFSRPYQKYCTQKALLHVKRSIEQLK